MTLYYFPNEHSYILSWSCRVMSANCTDGTIRLMVGEDYDFYRGETDYDTTYYIGDDLSRGRVEICKGGGYHTICLDSWDERDASVVCKEIGFSPNGEECDIHISQQTLSLLWQARL